MRSAATGRTLWVASRLAQVASDLGIEAFIHLSSGNLYRRGHSRRREQDALDPVAARSYYMLSKLAQEVFVLSALRGSGVRLVTLRPSAIYGPGMGGTGVVASMARLARDGDVFEVQQGGRYGADFVFVDDVVTRQLRSLRET